MQRSAPRMGEFSGRDEHCPSPVLLLINTHAHINTQAAPCAVATSCTPRCAIVRAARHSASVPISSMTITSEGQKIVYEKEQYMCEYKSESSTISFTTF